VATSRKPFRERAGLTIAALGLLVATLTFAVKDAAAAWSIFSPANPMAFVASIQSPAALRVSHQTELFGTYSALPSGTVIWAVTQDLDTNTLYPQDRPCSADRGFFNCGIYYVGRSVDGAGGRFKILIVAAAASASSDFLQYQLRKGGQDSNPGLVSLPAGCAIIGDKEVVRI
jgi:hypothetical protein